MEEINETRGEVTLMISKTLFRFIKCLIGYAVIIATGVALWIVIDALCLRFGVEREGIIHWVAYLAAMWYPAVEIGCWMGQ